MIPARFGSTRFPGKPLASILGRPMIVHTMLRAQKVASVQMVVVATDHVGIRDIVEGAGGAAVMTSSECETGTDRVGEALDVLQRERGKVFDIVVNVQGDEALACAPPRLCLFFVSLSFSPLFLPPTLPLPSPVSTTVSPVCLISIFLSPHALCNQEAPES